MIKKKLKLLKANFFWYGSELSLYERICIKSFVKNGFDVNVYSYKKLKLPKGANYQNASKIISKKYIYKFLNGGKQKCLAAFSDKFRIELFKFVDGWWFDMDTICLKKAKEFLKLEKNKKIIVGLETKHKVNNAVLKINDHALINTISKEISKKGFKLKWGDIGPNLINKILKDEGLLKQCLDQQYFYPVNYINYYFYLLPELKNKTKILCKNSYILHYYNEIFKRYEIPKNIMPPKNSFLYDKFIKICPNEKNKVSLPASTIKRLIGKKNDATSFSQHINDLLPSVSRAIKRRFTLN